VNSSSKNLIVEVISGPDGVETMSYVVESGTTRIFGGPRSIPIKDVTQVRDKGISGEHFRISNLGGSIRLMDGSRSGKASTNGTLINGRKVTDETIVDGTMFQAGKTKFQVRWEKRPDESDRKMYPTPIEPTMDSSMISKLGSGSSDGSSSGFQSPIESSMIDPPQLPIPRPLEEIDQGEAPSPLYDQIIEERRPIELNSPIDPPVDQESESDISPTPFPTDEPFREWNEPSPDADPVVRMILPTTYLWLDFNRIIQDLGRRYEFYAIAHLAKIADHGESRNLGIPLFPHLDSNGSALPVAIEKSNWLLRLHTEFGERLVAVDGLMIVVLDSDIRDVQESLQTMGRIALRGFSEEGGFVPWCWPSGATSVLDSMSDTMIGNWLSKSIVALVVPGSGRIVTYARPGHAETFHHLGFL
jgi:hypothetical protein